MKRWAERPLMNENWAEWKDKNHFIQIYFDKMHTVIQCMYLSLPLYSLINQDSLRKMQITLFPPLNLSPVLVKPRDAL